MSRNLRIKNALKAKRISQEMLATKLGVTQAAIGKQLNKKGDVDSTEFIKAVAELTGYSPDYLLNGQIEEERKKSEFEIEKLEMLVVSQKRNIELLEKEVKRLEEELKQNLKK